MAFSLKVISGCRPHRARSCRQMLGNIVGQGVQPTAPAGIQIPTADYYISD
jgi:hypothetical protein